MSAATCGPAPRVSVLVIDDRATNRRILGKLAQELADDVTVTDYEDAVAALEAVKAAPPDLVITDYKMPELDGASFVRAVREVPATAGVPVIVVTAYEDAQYRYDALRAGASDFLLTPVDRLEFVQRGRNLLTMQRQRKLLERRAKARERRLRMKTRLRERELYLTEEKFRLVINTLPALINAVDGDGRIAFANSYHDAVFGIDPARAVGHTLEEALTPAYARRHSAANAKVFETGESVSFEERIASGVAPPKTFLTSKAALPGTHRAVANVVTISIDITEQKQAEHALTAAKKAAQRANYVKTEFLANMSHELRTPLNAILGFADVTRRELIGPLGTAQYREYQEDIYSSAQQLLSLIDDLLDVSRLELGRLETRAAEVDPREIVESEIRARQDEAAREGLALNTTFEAEVTRFATDPTRFRQIVSNILSNAVKYTPAGGTIRITLAARAGGGEGVRLTVADDGAGMSAAQVETALSRFGRVRESGSPSRGGVGLGLPLAHDLARVLGGHLKVDSAPGRGTTVTVDLPGLGPDTDELSERDTDPGAEDGG